MTSDIPAPPSDAVTCAGLTYAFGDTRAVAVLGVAAVLGIAAASSLLGRLAR
ncbi:hypothetical protein [Streptomyces bungoensis]|uniref:hypothetical protein n=1 Tax=Streptomyces bungoensis TaxID=285568 RepID=UPI0033D0CD92